MMRGVLRSLFVLCVLGGIAFAEDPMPSEQAADPKPSGFEVVKKDPQPVITPMAKSAKHKKKHAKSKHKARKHKKAHRKAKHT
ncbi:MAG: hypothetical protein ABI678_13630 [Kofleriaceae bacterium]